METYLDAVRAFHDKNGVSAQQRLNSEPLEHLVALGEELVESSLVLQECVGDADKRWLRAHLLVEELGELLVAMGEGDEVETLDALSDLLYVLLGAAVTMDLPIIEGFAEAHVSNMTKSKQPGDPNGERLREKGPDYRPPDFAGVLERHRRSRAIVRPPRSLIAELEQRWRAAYSDPAYEGLPAQEKSMVDELIRQLGDSRRNQATLTALKEALKDD